MSFEPFLKRTCCVCVCVFFFQRSSQCSFLKEQLGFKVKKKRAPEQNPEEHHRKGTRYVLLEVMGKRQKT